MCYESEGGEVPADAFLDACPDNVEAVISATLEGIRAVPPPSFSGGGKWEAMHGSMAGYHEIRVTGPGRAQYRPFCILDNGSPGELAERGFDRPQIAVINGMVKRNAALFSDSDYRKHVRRFGDHYRATVPRPIARS